MRCRPDPTAPGEEGFDLPEYAGARLDLDCQGPVITGPGRPVGLPGQPDEHHAWGAGPSWPGLV